MRDNVPATERQQVISTHPDLVGGIIVGGLDGLDTAQSIVECLRPLPSAAIAVGTGERMLSTPAASDGGRFVVEPTPALHDEEAAAHERAAVDARITEVTRELNLLGQRITAVRDLLRQIANWRDACGMRTVSDLLGQLELLETSAEEAETALAVARTAAGEQETALEVAEDECERRTEGLETAQRIAEDLARLAEEETAADQARARIKALTGERVARTNELELLAGQIDQAGEDILYLARAIESAEQAADRHARAREEITSTSQAQQAHDASDATVLPLPLSSIAICKRRTN